ncbi:MAG TPA: hypothetical protein VN682_20530 [Terriglobales bacterium]|nr:hypothetical protein [Terriglobales bacterium]
MRQAAYVLGVHPNSRGIGWVLLEGAGKPLDWSIARTTDNKKCVALLDQFFESRSALCLVLEEYSGRGIRRGVRVQHLCGDIIKRAKSAGIPTYVYSKSDIQTCFFPKGGRDRYAIAKTIAKRVPGFALRLPPRRRLWVSEDSRLALFDAAAIALTHLARRPQ